MRVANESISANQIENYIRWITHYNEQAESFSDDNPADLLHKLEATVKCLGFIGKVSSIVDGDYKKAYAQRKLELAKAEVAALPPKKANAEIAIAHLREIESQLYEDMQRWRNARDYKTEEIHAIKVKLRMMTGDGSDV